MSNFVPYVGDCPNFLTNPSSEGFDQESSIKIVSVIKKEIAEFLGSESITFGRPLADVFASLLNVYNECYQEDWDGYGALAISRDAYEEARKIINLLPPSLEIPEIAAEPTGEIGLEWRKDRGHIFVISVNGRHRINYAGIFGGNTTHGSEYFEETLPSIIIEYLKRLDF